MQRASSSSIISSDSSSGGNDNPARWDDPYPCQDSFDSIVLVDSEALGALQQLVAALNKEVQLTTVATERCAVPSMVRESVQGLALAMQLEQHMQLDQDMQLEQLEQQEVTGAERQTEEAKQQSEGPRVYEHGMPCCICYEYFQTAKYNCCTPVCDGCMASHIRYGVRLVAFCVYVLFLDCSTPQFDELAFEIAGRIRPIGVLSSRQVFS